MRRSRGVLMAVTALAVLVAGCASSPPSAHAPGAAFAVQAEGASIDARPDGAVLHWSGSAVAAQGTPIVDPRWVVPHTWSVVASHALTLPAGTTVVRGHLNWTGSGSLLFLVSDESGQVWCGALTGTDGKEDCLTAIDPPRAEALHWTAQVLVELSDPQPQAIPYTLDLAVGNAPLPHLGPPAPYGPAAPLRFAPPVAVGTGDEPSLAVTPDGGVYVAARVFESGGLWYAPDGRTFTTADANELPYCELSGHRPPTGARSTADDSHLGCGDTDVAVSGADTVYFASHWGAEGVAVSHDAGATWFSNPFGSGPQVPHTDRQWLAADGPMRAYLAYIDVPGIEGQFTSVARSDDGGLTWLTVGHALGNACGLAGGIVTDSKGTVYLSGCTADGPALGVSTDQGLTWTWRTAARTAGSGGLAFLNFATVTVDAADQVHLAWIEPRSGGGSDIFVASTRDQGLTWTPPSRVNAEDGTFVFAWVTSGAAGKVAVAAYGTRVVGDPAGLLGDWYPIVAVTQDAFAPSPIWAQAAVQDTPIQYGPICVGGNSCANARNLGDFFQVQAGPDGAIDLAYADGSAGGGETLVRLIPSATVLYSHQVRGAGVGAPSLDKGRP